MPLTNRSERYALHFFSYIGYEKKMEEDSF